MVESQPMLTAKVESNLATSAAALRSDSGDDGGERERRNFSESNSKIRHIGVSIVLMLALEILPPAIAVVVNTLTPRGRRGGTSW